MADDKKGPLPGWPKTRYHPVIGEVVFNDPYEAAAVGQSDEEGDYRFKTAEEADRSRTDTEAGMAVAHNMRTKLAAMDEAKKGVVRNSVAAQASLDSGKAEPL